MSLCMGWNVSSTGRCLHRSAQCRKQDLHIFRVCRKGNWEINSWGAILGDSSCLEHTAIHYPTGEATFHSRTIFYSAYITVFENAFPFFFFVKASVMDENSGIWNRQCTVCLTTEESDLCLILSIHVKRQMWWHVSYIRVMYVTLVPSSLHWCHKPQPNSASFKGQATVGKTAYQICTSTLLLNPKRLSFNPHPSKWMTPSMNERECPLEGSLLSFSTHGLRSYNQRRDVVKDHNTHVTQTVWLPTCKGWAVSGKGKP